MADQKVSEPPGTAPGLGTGPVSNGGSGPPSGFRSDRAALILGGVGAAFAPFGWYAGVSVVMNYARDEEMAFLLVPPIIGFVGAALAITFGVFGFRVARTWLSAWLPVLAVLEGIIAIVAVLWFLAMLTPAG